MENNKPKEVIVTKTEQVLTSAPIKFGLGQISNPTPQIAKTIFRVVLYAAAVANIILQIAADDIPLEVRAIAAKYSLYAVTLVHAISKLFGIDISDIEPPSRQ